MIGINRHTVNAALLVLVGAATTGLGAQSSIGWRDNLSAARDEAGRAGRPVLVVITGGIWCDPCVWFEERILADNEFGSYVASRYVPVRIEDTSADYRELPVDVLPTIVILGADGVEAGRIGSPASLPGLVADLERVSAGDRAGPRPAPVGGDVLDGAEFAVEEVGRLWRVGAGEWRSRDAALPPRLEEYERDAEFVYLRDTSSRTDLALELSPPAAEWVLWRWDRDLRRWERDATPTRIR